MSNLSCIFGATKGGPCTWRSERRKPYRTILPISPPCRAPPCSGVLLAVLGLVDRDRSSTAFVYWRSFIPVWTMNWSKPNRLGLGCRFFVYYTEGGGGQGRYSNGNDVSFSWGWTINQWNQFERFRDNKRWYPDWTINGSLACTNGESSKPAWKVNISSQVEFNLRHNGGWVRWGIRMIRINAGPFPNHFGEINDSTWVGQYMTH